MNWWQTVIIILATAIVTWIGHTIIARREAKIQRAIHRDDQMKGEELVDVEQPYSNLRSRIS